MQKLFYKNGVNVEIAPEIIELHPWKKIWMRDKDREKRLALNEILYVYLMYNYDSTYSVFRPEDRKEKLIKHLNLNKLSNSYGNNRSGDWDEDQKLKECISAYLEIQNTPAIKALEQAKRGLLLTSDVMETITNTIQNAINNLSGDMSEITAAEEAEILKTLVANIQYLFKLAKDMPDVLKTLEALSERVKKEETYDNSRIKGAKAEIGDFEE